MPTEEPPEGIIHAATYGREICALKEDQTAVCWVSEYEESRRLQPPEGTFTRLTMSDTHVCGITTDAFIECWPDSGSVVPAPWHLYEYDNHPAQ